MRKPIRFLAFLLCFVLLFCFGTPLFTGASDARFANYVNMDDNAVENNYKIPNLFRQDGVYSNISKFPLVVEGGVEYVPVSMFILYPYVDVNYSKTSDSFFLINKKNNHYITFNVQESVASTHDGTLLQITTRIFNKTRYLPAREVASVLGFVCESYDNASKGVYAFRVSDGKSSKTLEQLIVPYINEFLPDSPPPPPPEDNRDPIEELAVRRVLLCYSGLGNNGTEQLLNTLWRNRIAASFALTKDDILQNHETVRDLYVKNYSFVITGTADGTTPAEYGESFVESLNEANDALKFVTKQKTKLCLLPSDLPDEAAQSEEFLDIIKKGGYIIFSPNVETGDGPEYTGSAYAVSTKIKNKITQGFDENTAAIVKASLYISDNSRYYTSDIAQFINNYAQFSFYAADEVYLAQN